MPPDSAQYLSPPQLAAIWAVAPEKIIAMIREGRLAGINLASRGSSRPRFRISRDAIRAFEQGQEVIPKPAPGPRRQSKPDCKLTRFI